MSESAVSGRQRDLIHAQKNANPFSTLRARPIKPRRASTRSRQGKTRRQIIFQSRNQQASDALGSASFVLNFDRKALKIPLNSLQAMVLNFAEVLIEGMPARCVSLFKKNFEEREKTECELRWQGELTKSPPTFLQK
jgi:hypothetical protein